MSPHPLPLPSPRHTQNLLKLALKCADVGHTAKNTPLHLVWTERVCEEFYKQGDQERKRGMSLSPFMDRRKPAVPKAQIGFIAMLCIPMYDSLLAVLEGDSEGLSNTTAVTTLSGGDGDVDVDGLPCLDRLYSNLRYWNSLVPEADRARIDE